MRETTAGWIQSFQEDGNISFLRCLAKGVIDKKGNLAFVISLTRSRSRNGLLYQCNNAGEARYLLRKLFYLSI